MFHITRNIHTLVMDRNPNPAKIDRKTIEKKRRKQMKSLYSTLTSLVPDHRSPREVTSISDQLEGAADYIKKLQINIGKMKEKKKCLMANSSSTHDDMNNNNNGPMFMRSSNSGSASESKNSPSIDVIVMGSALEVVLVSGPTCQLVFSEILQMLHEEAAEVVTASVFVLQNMVFHTIHCKISGDECSIKYGAARISERLRKYVCHKS